MQMPKANAEAVAVFEAIRPVRPEVTVRSVFGQPAAFVAGNMFLGVFGENVFLRLSDADRTRAVAEAAAHPFEPMPGRPMREYVVLPRSTLTHAQRGGEWVRRSLEYAASLPAKAPGSKRATAPRGAARPARAPASMAARKKR